MMIASVVFVTVISAVSYGNVRTQKSADKCVFDFGVAALNIQGDPHLLYLTAGQIVCVEFQQINNAKEMIYKARGMK